MEVRALPERFRRDVALYDEDWSKGGLFLVALLLLKMADLEERDPSELECRGRNEYAGSGCDCWGGGGGPPHEKRHSETGERSDNQGEGNVVESLRHIQPTL
jgi:hypothetical protein